MWSPDGLRFDSLFWDFACVPEPDAHGYISDADLARQQKAFGHMNELCKSRSQLEPIALCPLAQASTHLRLRSRRRERVWHGRHPADVHAAASAVVVVQRPPDR